MRSHHLVLSTLFLTSTLISARPIPQQTSSQDTSTLGVASTDFTTDVAAMPISSSAADGDDYGEMTAAAGVGSAMGVDEVAPTTAVPTSLLPTPTSAPGAPVSPSAPSADKPNLEDVAAQAIGSGSPTTWSNDPKMTDLSSFLITKFAFGQDNVKVLSGGPSAPTSIAPYLAQSTSVPSATNASEMMDIPINPATPIWDNSENTMQVRFPAGSVNPGNNPRGGADFYAAPLDLAHAKNVTLEYEVFFPANFSFVKGGKLPGLYGGHEGCSGGDDAEGCFSTRMMWRADGAGELYLYVPKDKQPASLCQTPPKSLCTSTFGLSIGTGSFYFNRGDWTKIRQDIWLNTPGETDGGFNVWADDKLVMSSAEVLFREKEALMTRDAVNATAIKGEIMDATTVAKPKVAESGSGSDSIFAGLKTAGVANTPSTPVDLPATSPKDDVSAPSTPEAPGGPIPGAPPAIPSDGDIEPEAPTSPASTPAKPLSEDPVYDSDAQIQAVIQAIANSGAGATAKSGVSSAGGVNAKAVSHDPAPVDPSREGMKWNSKPMDAFVPVPTHDVPADAPTPSAAPANPSIAPSSPVDAPKAVQAADLEADEVLTVTMTITHTRTADAGLNMAAVTDTIPSLPTAKPSAPVSSPSDLTPGALPTPASPQAKSYNIVEPAAGAQIQPSAQATEAAQAKNYDLMNVNKTGTLSRRQEDDGPADDSAAEGTDVPEPDDEADIPEPPSADAPDVQAPSTPAPPVTAPSPSTPASPAASASSIASTDSTAADDSIANAEAAPSVPSAVKFAGLFFSTFFGGSSDEWKTPVEQEIYFKAFKMTVNE